MSIDKLISLCLAGFFIFSFPGFSQNIALNKSYDLSVKPNYPYTAPFTDKKSLTDGVYTTDNRFWTQKTTVGWQLQNVSITIDLNQIQTIDSVIFSTGRASDVGVYYPKNIFIFLSNDKTGWKYVGDAADVIDNLPGTNQRKNFSISKINQSGRYVKISVIRQGLFIFCDEIKVIKGQKLDNKKFLLVRQDSLAKVIDSLQLPDNNRRGILRQSNSLSYLRNGAILKSTLQDPNVSYNFQNYKRELGEQNANYLNTKFIEPYTLEMYNPWENLDEFRKPSGSSGNLNYNFNMIPIGDVRYGSFLLTNLNLKNKQFYFKFLQNSKYNLEVYAVPFVSSSFYNTIPDPMVEVKDSFLINPGESQMFIFELTGREEGTTQGMFNITSSEKISQINYNVGIINNFVNQNSESLNVNVWAYFTGPLVNDHKKEVSEDLQQHHVNTMVVPPTFLPRIKDTAFSSFTTYLQNLKGSKNILLYMDYSLPERRNNYKGGDFMSDEWKGYFKIWYKNILNIVSKNVGTDTDIYLYPYDEISNQNFSDFKRLIKWTRNAIPGVKFYATLNTQNSIDSILPLVDIAQVLPSLAKILPAHTCEIWIYTGNTPSRALSPYSFYRLMSWDAFFNGYKGIGFWNYASESNGNNLNLISDKFLNLSSSFSVIYNDVNGNILSSRRWEAFRLGIEDYSILQKYAKKFGDAKAKELASQVIINPGNLNLADSIRDNMLTELIQINK